MRVLVRVLPTLSAVVVATASFALSYVALRDVAAATQAVPASMAWLVPICVDGAVLAGSASLWASSMRAKRKDPVAVLTVVSLLVISVIINVNHAGDDVLAKVIAALPPLTLLACLELVAAQYRRDAEDAAQADGVGEAAEEPRAVTDLTPDQPPAPVRTPTALPTVPLAPEAAQFDVPGAAETVSVERPAPPQAAEQPAASAPVSAAVSAPAQVLVPAPEREEKVAPPAAQRPRAAGATPVDADVRPAQRQPRTKASAPTREKSASVPTDSAGSADAGEELSGADRIRAAFQEHLDAGGEPTDPTLARRFAGDLGLQQAYVRKVLGPLRRELEPVG